MHQSGIKNSMIQSFFSN